MSELMSKVAEYRPYVFNLKALVGIVFLLFALNASYTTVTEKWAQYFNATAANTKLIEDKKNLSNEEVKLKAISKELDKLTIKTTQLKAEDSPELAILSIAQKVVALAEDSKNIFDSLDPHGSKTIPIDTVVSLPINFAGAAPVQPASPDPNAAQQPVSTPAQAPPANGGLNTYEYTLTVHGTYANLATFIHELVNLTDFVLIRGIDVRQASQEAIDKANNADLVTMKLDFSVPWRK